LRYFAGTDLRAPAAAGLALGAEDLTLAGALPSAAVTFLDGDIVFFHRADNRLNVLVFYACFEGFGLACAVFQFLFGF